ncbi:MAG: class I SAM-dependent methyltransferase [Pyrinomonadaceae bacterium]
MNHEDAKPDTVYEQYYGQNKFHYDYSSYKSFIREWLWVRLNLVRRFNIRRGSRVLEIACGQGFHVNLLGTMGMKVIGSDISQAAIKFATQRYPNREFLQADGTGNLPYPAESFDVVWSRGAAFFHYDVTDEKSFEIVRQHLRYVKPGGLYVLVIATDLSGRKPADWEHTWMNTLADYETLLRRFDMPYTIDWEPDRKSLPVIGRPLKNGLAIGSLRKPLLPGNSNRVAPNAA